MIIISLDFNIIMANMSDLSILYQNHTEHEMENPTILESPKDGLGLFF
jgi:hypothetical protein